jgi:hypothetical protein
VARFTCDLALLAVLEKLCFLVKPLASLAELVDKKKES